MTDQKHAMKGLPKRQSEKTEEEQQLPNDRLGLEIFSEIVPEKISQVSAQEIEQQQKLHKALATLLEKNEAQTQEEIIKIRVMLQQNPKLLLNSTDSRYRGTPLHTLLFAANEAKKKGYHNKEKLLTNFAVELFTIAKNHNVKMNVETKNINGNTPLHWAIYYENSKVVEVIANYAAERSQLKTIMEIGNDREEKIPGGETPNLLLNHTLKAEAGEGEYPRMQKIIKTALEKEKQKKEENSKMFNEMDMHIPMRKRSGEHASGQPKEASNVPGGYSSAPSSTMFKPEPTGSTTLQFNSKHDNSIGRPLRSILESFSEAGEDQKKSKNFFQNLSFEYENAAYLKPDDSTQRLFKAIVNVVMQEANKSIGEEKMNKKDFKDMNAFTTFFNQLKKQINNQAFNDLMKNSKIDMNDIQNECKKRFAICQKIAELKSQFFGGLKRRVPAKISLLESLEENLNNGMSLKEAGIDAVNKSRAKCLKDHGKDFDFDDKVYDKKTKEVVEYVCGEIKQAKRLSI